MQKADWKKIHGAITFEFGCFLGRAIYPKKAAEMLVKPLFCPPKKCQPRGIRNDADAPLQSNKMYSEACAHNAM